MCNLSQGIREKGGDEREKKIITNMFNKGFSLEQIADATDKEVDEVKTIIENKDAVLV